MLNAERCFCARATTVPSSLRGWTPLSTDMLNTHMINGHLKRLVLFFYPRYGRAGFGQSSHALGGLTYMKWLRKGAIIKDHPDPFQIQNNWSYGETLDENAKTHPMLRPYKTFSEKVSSLSLWLLLHFSACNNSPLFLPVGQRDLPLANQRVNKSHDCMGVEHR